jgi:hypothetical protein
VNRQLLDGAGYGCAQFPQAGTLRRLDQLLPLLGRVLGRLAQCTEGLTMELRIGFAALLDEAGDLCLRAFYPPGLPVPLQRRASDEGLEPLPG